MSVELGFRIPIVRGFRIPKPRIQLYYMLILCSFLTLEPKTAKFDMIFKFKVDRLQIIVVAKKYIYVSELFISWMPKMSAIPQLVSAPLNPIPICRTF